MDDKKFKFPDDSKIINEIINVGDDKILNRTFEVYSYKFPNNSIFVGYTPHGLDRAHSDHSRCSLSPIYKILKEYTNVYPEVELIVENTTYNELRRIQRKVFDSNLNMKILNENLWLYGY